MGRPAVTVRLGRAVHADAERQGRRASKRPGDGDSPCGANTLRGEAGNDLLKGGPGVDVLDGGAGVDVVDYRDQTGAMLVKLNGAGAGTALLDGVLADTLRNIESVYGGGGADNLQGDALANNLRGGDGDDVLKGGQGRDVLDGETGFDLADYRDKTVAVEATLNGGASVTVTVGRVAEDTSRNIEGVMGGTAADTLRGDALANTLRGGLGGDTLTGGAGSDTFSYATLADSTAGGPGQDTITDFAAGDRINLRLIDAIAGGADDAFTIGTLAAGSPGRLQITTVPGGPSLILGDVDGDGTADFAISVQGATPTASDFLL